MNLHLITMSNVLLRCSKAKRSMIVSQVSECQMPVQVGKLQASFCFFVDVFANSGSGNSVKHSQSSASCEYNFMNLHIFMFLLIDISSYKIVIRTIKQLVNDFFKLLNISTTIRRTVKGAQKKSLKKLRTYI